MTKSDQIRCLATEGIPRAEIARRLGIRYQFVRNVLVRAESQKEPTHAPPQAVSAKPCLTTDQADQMGFTVRASWRVQDGILDLSEALPKERGVYAFSVDGLIMYVGLASRGIAARLYSYKRPGNSQRTNIRLNAQIQALINSGKAIEILVAHPPDFYWNECRVSGPEGLEAALIRDFSLPWNKRGI